MSARSLCCSVQFTLLVRHGAAERHGLQRDLLTDCGRDVAFSERGKRMTTAPWAHRTRPPITHGRPTRPPRRTPLLIRTTRSRPRSTRPMRRCTSGSKPRSARSAPPCRAGRSCPQQGFATPASTRPHAWPRTACSFKSGALVVQHAAPSGREPADLGISKRLRRPLRREGGHERSAARRRADERQGHQHGS